MKGLEYKFQKNHPPESADADPASANCYPAMQKKKTVALILTTLASMAVVTSIGLNFLLLGELQEIRKDRNLNSEEHITDSPVLKEFLVSRKIFNERTSNLVREPDAMTADLEAVLALEQLELMKEVLEGKVALENPELLDVIDEDEMP